MPADNLARMHLLDKAWNERSWDEYSGLLDPSLRGYASDRPGHHDHDQHVANAKAFCLSFPDARVHDPYLAAFLSGDGMRTCTVSRVTGREALTGAEFDVTMAVICLWEEGHVIEQYQFLEDALLTEQLRAVSLKDEQGDTK